MGRDTPRYFIEAKGSCFWQPSSELRRAGWRPRPLGKDRSAAVAAAIAANAEVDAWYAADRPALEGGAAARRTSSPASCNALFDLYQDPARNPDYPTNKNTKRQYDGAIDYLRKWLGPVPPRAVTPRMAKQRHDALAATTPAQAASIMRVARAAFGKSRFLVDPGSPLYVGVKDNPFLELDLKGSDTEGRLWTREERDAMVKTAFQSNTANYPSIGLAIGLNWWFAQREADILALPPNALEGDGLIIRQNKTTRRVDLPVAIIPEIHELAASYRTALAGRGISSLTHLLINERTGQPWDEHAFRKAFREIRELAGADDGLQFMHLRHTGVVNMEDAGGTIPEICGVSGHSLQSATQILERYGRRTRRQAENAIRKRIALERKGEADGG